MLLGEAVLLAVRIMLTWRHHIASDQKAVVVKGLARQDSRHSAHIFFGLNSIGSRPFAALRTGRTHSKCKAQAGKSTRCGDEDCYGAHDGAARRRSTTAQPLRSVSLQVASHEGNASRKKYQPGDGLRPSLKHWLIAAKLRNKAWSIGAQTFTNEARSVEDERQETRTSIGQLS